MNFGIIWSVSAYLSESLVDLFICIIQGSEFCSSTRGSRTSDMAVNMHRRSALFYSLFSECVSCSHPRDTTHSSDTPPYISLGVLSNSNTNRPRPWFEKQRVANVLESRARGEQHPVLNRIYSDVRRLQ